MSAVLKSVSYVFFCKAPAWWSKKYYIEIGKYLSEEIDFSRWGKNLSIVPQSKTKIVDERRDRNNRAWLMFSTFSYVGFLTAKRTFIFLLFCSYYDFSPRIIGSWCFPLFSSSCIFPQWSKAPNESRSLSWAAKTAQERKWDHSYLSTQSVYHRKEFRLGTQQIPSTI